MASRWTEQRDLEGGGPSVGWLELLMRLWAFVFLSVLVLGHNCLVYNALPMPVLPSSRCCLLAMLVDVARLQLSGWTALNHQELAGVLAGPLPASPCLDWTNQNIQSSLVSFPTWKLNVPSSLTRVRHHHGTLRSFAIRRSIFISLISSIHFATPNSSFSSKPSAHCSPAHYPPYFRGAVRSRPPSHMLPDTEYL